MVRLMYESERLLADLDRRNTIDNVMRSPVNSSSERFSGASNSSRMQAKGGDGASLTDTMNPRHVPMEDPYKVQDKMYDGELWDPNSQSTEPSAKEIDLKKKMYGQQPMPNRLMADAYGSGNAGNSLERMTDFYQVDKQGKLQASKEGFNRYMSSNLFEACMMYFSNVGQPAKPTDGAYLAQRQGFSKKQGYNLTDLTGSFYNVANGKLQPSKQGFSAYLNVALTNAAFSYFGNVGTKAPAGYLGNGSASRGASAPSGKSVYAGGGKK